MLSPQQKSARTRLWNFWIAALESGKYKRTQGTLHKIAKNGKDTFCCLGLFCFLKQKSFNLLVEEGLQREISYNGDRSYLPDEVAKALGISQEGHFKMPVKFKGKDFYSLADLNDAGASFKQIARIMRKNMDNFMSYEDGREMYD